MTADVVLRTSGLVKRFGTLTAVDRLDLEVGRGEVVGLLGPNGAGKSTTIGMVLGLVAPDAGRAEVNGKDVATHRDEALAHLAEQPSDVLAQHREDEEQEDRDDREQELLRRPALDEIRIEQP